MNTTHRSTRRRRWTPARACLLTLTSSLAIACTAAPPSNEARASGYVEATEIRVAAEVAGRLVERRVEEGDPVEPGAILAILDTTDTELALQRARAERFQADAQLRLLRAGPRPQEIRQAEAQVQAAKAQLEAATVELTAATRDLERFESLLDANSGSRKQRDDAATRRDVASARVNAAGASVHVSSETVATLRAGARSQEIDAATARVAGADAQIATLEKRLRDATILSPVRGTVTQTVLGVGELVLPGSPLLVITDLDRAWANLFVDEPIVPRLRLGQSATIRTDAGGDDIPGRVTFISPRAEFTPRNVQTAEERSKLVYRIKVSTDNRDGVLKQGMPVEAIIPLQPVGPDERSESGR